MSPGGGPLLLSHPACALHHAPGHPERPERLEAIEAALAADPNSPGSLGLAKPALPAQRCPVVGRAGLGEG